MNLKDFKENFIKILSANEFNPQDVSESELFQGILVNFEEFNPSHDDVGGLITIKLDEGLYRITAYGQCDRKGRFAYEGFSQLYIEKVIPKEITLTIYEPEETSEVIDFEYID